MSSMQQKNRRRRLTARRSGQALPLIGLMIVIVVAMVGLSVDVGNTFSEERQAVAAGNAASVAAMDAYIDRTSSTTNLSIYTTIINTLQSNGVEVAAQDAEPVNGQLKLEALYLDSQGKLIENASPVITNEAKTVPGNVAFIQVNLTGRVDTYFARVVGRDAVAGPPEQARGVLVYRAQAVCVLHDDRVAREHVSRPPPPGHRLGCCYVCGAMTSTRVEASHDVLLGKRKDRAVI